MKKLLLAVAMLLPLSACVTSPVMAWNGGYYPRYSYYGYNTPPAIYQYPYPYYRPHVYVVPPPVVYAPPPPVVYAQPPFVDPGLAMFNYWAGVVIRGLNCGPRYIGVDQWGRPVYRPIC